MILGACATRPPARPLPEVGQQPVPIRVDDESGPLNAAQAAAAVKRIEGEDVHGLLARHLGEVEAVMSAPLALGNSARLLIDGPQTERAMLRAINRARHHIDLETYLLEPAGIGERLASALEAKRAERVAVRVLYDSIGSLATPHEYFARLKAAGIAVCEFNPVSPLRLQGDARLSLNNRDHRKLLIVDNRVAFTGGINISSVYSSGSFSRRSAAPSRTEGWRDTHVAVRGPVVDQFQKRFDDTWRSQGCPDADGAEPRINPPAVRAGGMAMRLVAADPLAERNELYLALLSAIEHAQRRVWLTYGYFVPDERIRLALQDAARRGVDVRLVLPGFSDFWAPLYAGRSRYSELLEAGVRIFERHDALLHAKTAVIDGVWSSVGSTNLDWRSLVHNFEADLLVLDSGFANELQQLFGLDQSASYEVVRSDWSRRGVKSRLLEWLVGFWEYML
ncbi:phospholipase D-like domain-containing protein [Dechloromonas sp. A34]|uniref:phospholipase D-like domain-containing protein n=1 Tax=Dechloromonas sp. A34 TaxID=447588 RepID=UPI0022488AFD|nr:phospholipase D-like domain-containing protein [Dechloromonas sp. A34]